MPIADEYRRALQANLMRVFSLSELHAIAREVHLEWATLPGSDSKDLEAVTSALIDACEREGCLPALLASAQRARPDDPNLAQLSAQQQGGVRFEDNADVNGIIVGGNVYGNIYFYGVASEAAFRKPRPVVATNNRSKPSCPYPGMLPFRPQDTRFFYGREKLIEEMVLRLRGQSFLLVIGPSGSGKSSLVYAGLLPQLAVSEYWEPGFWHMVTMRPGAQPMSSLAEALRGDPKQPADTLRALLTTQAPAQRLLLVVDQFEEVFTQVLQGETGSDALQARRERQTEFITALKQLRDLDMCTVVLTMRANFYPDLLDSELWPLGEEERQEITPLKGEELRDAIKQPAASVGVEVEDGLVERLLADAADQRGILPLLQETLLLLWKRMERRTLTLASYEELGSGGRSGLAEALAIKADATMSRLAPDQRTLARRIFLRLIQFGEGRPDTRRQQTLPALRSMGDDPALFDQTLAKLTNDRLLTMSGEEKDAEKKVDLAHEALIRDWPTLRKWIKRRRDEERIRRRLEYEAAEWVRLGRGAGGLLDVTQLPEAERWLAGEYAQDLGYSKDLIELIKASKAAVKQAEQDKLAQIRIKARNKVLAKGLIILGGLIILLFAAFLTAANLGTVAYQQGVIVRAQALAANAVAQLDVDPERSLLLAMEAVTTSRRMNGEVVPQVHEALDQAVARSRVRSRWRAHHDDVTTVAYSPDGKYIVTGSKDHSVSIWEASTGELVTTLKGEQGHTELVTSVAFSPKGNLLITASEDNTVKIWGTTNWHPVSDTLKLSEKRNQALDAASSPDERFIVVATREGKAQIWDTVEKRWVHTLDHKERVTSASFSPDGQHVLTASWDETVRVWDVITGTTSHVFKGHTGRVTHARYSPDGTSIVSASEDGTARIWDANQDEEEDIDANQGEEKVILRGHNDWVNDARYSPDGRSIVTASRDRTAKVWDATSGEERFTLRGHTDVVTSAMYSPDGRTIVTVSQDQTVRVWDANDQLAWVLRAVYNDKGSLILTANSDNTAKVWDAVTVTLQPVITITGHTGLLYSALFSPDQKHIVTASADGTAKVWDIDALPAGTVITQPMMTLTHTGTVRSAAYSPKGEYIVTASPDNKDDIDNVIIWDAIHGQPLITFTHKYDLTSATFSPDGKRIIATSQGKVAVIWDVITPQEASIPAPEPVITLTEHTDNVYDAAFSPDGTRIVTSSSDRTAAIWDARDGTLIRILRGHENVVRRAAYSTDGRFIITASWDNTAKIWDAETGQLRLTLRGHRNWVMSAAFSPDGKNIVTSSADGTIYQRPIDIDELLALAEKRVTRQLTVDEKSTYLSQSCTLSILGICLP
jgi:WD40 repeat protein